MSRRAPIIRPSEKLLDFGLSLRMEPPVAALDLVAGRLIRTDRGADDRREKNRLQIQLGERGGDGGDPVRQGAARIHQNDALASDGAKPAPRTRGIRERRIERLRPDLDTELSGRGAELLVKLAQIHRFRWERNAPDPPASISASLSPGVACGACSSLPNRSTIEP